MSSDTLVSRKSLHLGVVLVYALVLPLWVWAVRAPDPAYAPLPDYDIRKGYSGLMGLNDPRVAHEQLQLRQQRAAKLVAEEPAAPGWTPAAEAVSQTFGPDTRQEWGGDGVLRHLVSPDSRRPLAPGQPGLDPVAVAREFLRAHQDLFHLDDSAIDSLQVVRTDVDAEGREVAFRQTLNGVPIYQADFKVSLDARNAVLGVSGNWFPELTVKERGKLSAVDAAAAGARYVGPPAFEKFGKKIEPRKTAAAPAADSGWAQTRVTPTGVGPHGEFAPEVIASEAGPEAKTTLSRGPFPREVTASRIIFPLTAAQGREAWQVDLMKSPLESYQLLIDAADGTLLARVNQVKFTEPQGLVFLTNPDDGAQVLRSFVGNATASRRGLVYATQSGLQGNNVIMSLGANDTSGPRHFEFAFTNDYETSGGLPNNFNLNGATLQFTPNSSGGYDFTLPGSPASFSGTTQDLGMGDESVVCGADPAGFTFFGASTSQVCVSSNGEVTINGFSASVFVSPFDFLEDQLSMALGRGRIMGLWDDLDATGIADGIDVFFAGSATNPSALCFNWNGVPEFGPVGSNTFSICMFGTGNPSGLPVGTIQIHYTSVAALDGMVGIAPGKTGKGQPRSAGFSDFSGPTSALGGQGLARLFPDHDDADAAATNAFWIMNEIGHDKEYLAGFTEKLKNMQWKNFLRKAGRVVGLGKDAVVGTADLSLEGDFSDNAFFSPTNEGVCCPLAVFGLFTAGGVGRNADAAFDTDVVAHEYGHGVSTRLEGAQNTFQTGAMGEGWSDWFALDYSGDPVMGEYVTGNATTGIRTVAYDSSSPYHFGHFANLLGPLCCLNDGSSVFAPEVHQDGEIWATMLSDLRTGLLGAAVPATTVSKLIVVGIKNTPANASMLQARDGLVTAAGKLSLNKCLLWQVFADNGFGQNAANNEVPDTSLAGDSFNGFQSFDRPSTCGGSFSNAAAPLSSDSFDAVSDVVGNTSSAGGWVGTGLWHVSNDRRASSPNSFYFGQEQGTTGTGGGTYNTGFTEFGSLTSPALNLSATTHPVLEFSLFMTAEEEPPFDVLWVRASIDGGATYPIQLAQFIWDTNTAFRSIRLGLEDLAGQANVKIRFTFDTLDSIGNSFEGVYIDNVVIRNYTEN